MRTVPILTSLEQLAPSGSAWLKELGNAFVDLLFPPRCVACHRLGPWLCPQCRREIEVIQPPVCLHCGQPLDEGVAPGAKCARCQSASSALDGLRAYAYHSGPLREAIHQFKYEDLRSLTAPLGELMAKGWNALAPDGCEIDALVPVPLHASRLRQRGYNQAALLAHELGASLQLPVVEDVLVRVKATAPQVGLGAKARQLNVKGAFQCVNDSLSGRQVLLIDDVCTTGSTLEAGATALREQGAASVWAYTLARAR